MDLLELGSSIVFSVWNANGCGADIEVAMLVVAAVRHSVVEVEFDVDGMG